MSVSCLFSTEQKTKHGITTVENAEPILTTNCLDIIIQGTGEGVANTKEYNYYLLLA